MRLVIQRVAEASVSVAQQKISEIGQGLLTFVCVEEGDSSQDVDWLAAKTANMRLFSDDNGLMNLSVMDIAGNILAISQFTLIASTKKGNRPSYIRAAERNLAMSLYDEFCDKLTSITGREVIRGIFGADMQVKLINDGPVTIIIDSKRKE